MPVDVTNPTGSNDLIAFATPTPDVPSGWRPIRDLCERVGADLDALTERVVAAVEIEIPVYRTVGAVPRADLNASVHRNLEMMLFGISENRGPMADELAVRRTLGHRRAQQGLPIDALLQAYHVGYRELWQALVDATADDDAQTKELLLRAATTVWRWVHDVTAAVSQAYHETASSLELLAAGVRHRFLDVLLTGDAGSEEAIATARGFGFDPVGDFLAIAIAADPLGGGRETLVRRAVEPLGGACVITPRGEHLVLLTQRINRDALIAAVRPLLPTDTPLGTGMARTGLPGARESIGDAERAFGYSRRRGRPSDFTTDWWIASLHPAEARLTPAIERAHLAAHTHPAIADAVRAFAEARFSMTETGRRLSIHVNSVVYRLDRWHRLTGWDPRTFDGLVRSMIALELADPAGAESV